MRRYASLALTAAAAAGSWPPRRAAHDPARSKGGGRDLLTGGDGNDRLRGGPKHDNCAGGPGRDSANDCEFKSGIP
jgi:hemolysin type calcium-binding protein